MEPHNWQQSRFEPSHLYQGFLTAVQFYRCRHCKSEVGLPDGPMRPESHGCTGIPLVEKKKWRSPMKEKDCEQKKDYPAKKKKR